MKNKEINVFIYIYIKLNFNIKMKYILKRKVIITQIYLVLD